MFALTIWEGQVHGLCERLRVRLSVSNPIKVVESFCLWLLATCLFVFFPVALRCASNQQEIQTPLGRKKWKFTLSGIP